jgi:silicon transporter
MKHLSTPAGVFKSVYSIIALIFSIVLIMGLIAKEQTKLSSDATPVVAYICIWVAIIWLSMVEGGQGSLVGLAPVNRELYKESHPRAYKCTSVAHVGDNLDRYLLGRQFMVVLVVFVVNMSGGPLEGAELWGLPKVVTDIFLSSGLAMILLTCMVGQLNSQVNASHCMLDYINNYFATFTFWVAMAIEFSGLLHASYVLQKLVSVLSGKKIESEEPPRTAIQSIFFWSRCLMSLAILGFCFAVTFEALFNNKTTIWDGVPPGAALVIFFFLMSVVGMLEGMQIAFFAVAKLPASERGEGTFAKKTCDLLFRGEGNNLPGFMIGRQLCVVSCMFFIARVTSVQIEEGEENIFGVGSGMQNLFNTGLLGAMIVTIVGSIAWQLVASAFPLAFLSNPVTYFLLVLCLGLEATGICNGAWVLAAINRKVAGWQRDEEYIGTAEERAKRNMEDNEDELMHHVGPGHIAKLPGFDMDNAPKALKKLMNKDPSVREFVNDILSASQTSAGDGIAEENV